MAIRPILTMFLVYSSAAVLKVTIMGKSSNVWVPGFVADHPGAPEAEEDYSHRGILAAYQEADRYVYEKPNTRFCVVGPGCWLRKWDVPESKEVKFKPAPLNRNVTLRFEWRKGLKFVVDDELEFLENESNYNWGYLYFKKRDMKD